MNETTSYDPDKLISKSFRAINHLIMGLPVIPYEKVHTQWVNYKVNKVRFPAEELLDALQGASRGERALIEAALTLYNGGEYLVGDTYGGPFPQGRNVLRHVMDWTDDATFRRIVEAMEMARGMQT